MNKKHQGKCCNKNQNENKSATPSPRVKLEYLGRLMAQPRQGCTCRRECTPLPSGWTAGNRQRLATCLSRSRCAAFCVKWGSPGIEKFGSWWFMMNYKFQQPWISIIGYHRHIMYPEVAWAQSIDELEMPSRSLTCWSLRRTSWNLTIELWFSSKIHGSINL